MSTVKWKPKGINDYVGITIDFETGGFDCNKNGITEVAVNAFSVRDLVMFDRLHLKIYPYFKKTTGNKRLVKKGDPEDSGELMVYEQEALDFCGITMKELQEEGVDINEAGRQVLDFIERARPNRAAKNKPFFMGHNIQFDLGFWAQFMEYTGLEKEAARILNGKVDYWGNFQPHYIDTMDVAKLALGNNTLVDKYGLQYISGELGIPLVDAHDAGADTDATFNVYAAIASKTRNGGKVDPNAIYQQEKERKAFNI